MKKIVFLLVFVLVFSLCGCGEKGKEKKQLEVDIEYYSNLGQMPECKFKLGESTDKLEELIAESAESHEHDHEAVYYDMVVGDDYTTIYAGDDQYYFNNTKKDKGIAMMVSYEGGYGFDAGSVSIEIKEELSAAGYEAKERAAEDEDIFFLPSASDFTCLEYTFKDNTVKFIFENNELCACTLSGKNWSIK